MRNIEFCLDYLIVANKTEFVGKEGEEPEVRGSIVDQDALDCQKLLMDEIQEESQNSQRSYESSRSGSHSMSSNRSNSMRHHSDNTDREKGNNSRRRNSDK